MGSFKGHVLPGTLFLLVGLWRVWSSASRFAAAPSAFRVRAWNPVPCSPATPSSPLRLLELYVIAAGAFADMCVEVLYSTHLRIFAGGGVNPAHLNDLEHGGMLLMFFLFGALALASQLKPRSVCLAPSSPPSPSPSPSPSVTTRASHHLLVVHSCTDQRQPTRST
jgi:hypothetical protein